MLKPKLTPLYIALMLGLNSHAVQAADAQKRVGTSMRQPMPR